MVAVASPRGVPSARRGSGAAGVRRVRTTRAFEGRTARGRHAASRGEGSPTPTPAGRVVEGAKPSSRAGDAGEGSRGTGGLGVGGTLLWAPVGALALGSLLVVLSGTTGAAHAVEAVSAGSWSPDLFVPGLVGDDEFREGFTSGLLLVLFSEIGDKTFFVAMLLAIRTNSLVGVSSDAPGPNSLGAESLDRRWVVFAGTFAALAVMTVISCGIGITFHSLENFVPESLSKFPIDDLAAVVLLTAFGVTSLKDAQGMEGEKVVSNDALEPEDVGSLPLDIRDEEGSEREEAIALVKEMEDEGKITGQQGASSLLLQTFLLVFAAEWGDRSFLSTIALSAAYPPPAVVMGASLGHGVATALAIGGGTVLAQYISEKTIAYIAGVLFSAFATATTIDLVAGNHVFM